MCWYIILVTVLFSIFDETANLLLTKSHTYMPNTIKNDIVLLFICSSNIADDNKSMQIVQDIFLQTTKAAFCTWFVNENYEYFWFNH